MMQNTWKWLKPWHMGTHQRVLSESYPMNTNMIGLSCFPKDFASLCLDESSLGIGRVKEGLERMGLGLDCLPGPI